MTSYAQPPHDAPPMGGPDDAELAADEAHLEHQRQVMAAVRRQRVELEARDIVKAERAAAQQVPPFDAGMLSDVLARPAGPPHRVEDLIPADAGTLLVAQRKTGKTTLQLNLARSLILGDDFLGKFPTMQLDGNVAFLNYEVGSAQLARWAHEAGIPADRFFLVTLRGRRNPLGHDVDRESLAKQLRLRDTEALIVDPFGRAYTGASQNDPGEVGSWLADLDRFARGDVGAKDVVLAAHAGWNGERVRGATALEDWADSIINLTRDDDQVRYLRAEGRDIDVPEDQLNFDPRTRYLTLAGAGSRKTAQKVRQLDALMPAVINLLKATPAMSGNQLDVALRKLINDGDLDATCQKGDGARAAQLLEKRGLVVSKDGPRGSRLFSHLFTSPTSPELPQGNSDDLPDLPLKGEVIRGKSHSNDLPDDHQETA